MNKAEMKVATTKSVDWSYPSSANAVRFRFPKGCWTVSIQRSAGIPEAVKGFATREEAITEAAKMRMAGVIVPWNKIFLKMNPNLVTVHESTE